LELWFAALLGLVQGLTEFLPISSTAHLRIAPALLGQPDPGAAFTAVVQLGTLAAVVVYFARDLIAMPRALLREPHTTTGRLPIYLALGTVPIGLAGIALKGVIVGPARSLYVVAPALILFAVVMFVADRRGRRSRGLASIDLRDALLIGAAQALSLIPGVSRSGATIAGALLLGLSRPDAARFSFLLGIPAIAAAGLFELPDAVSALAAASAGSSASPWLPLGVATAVAAISGYASIAWLLRFVATRSFTPFVAYRIAVGAALLALCVLGLLDPNPPVPAPP
jgi:undecaprenyl-diphosphatase